MTSVLPVTPYNGIILAVTMALSVFIGQMITVRYYSVRFSFRAAVCDIAAMLTIFLLLNLIPVGIVKKIMMTLFFAFFYACTLVETVYVGFWNDFAPIRSIRVAGKYAKGTMGLRLNPAAYISIAFAVIILVFSILLPTGNGLNIAGVCAAGAALLAAAALYCGIHISGRKRCADTLSFIRSPHFAYQTIYSASAYVGKYGYWSYHLRELTFKPGIPGKAEIDAYFEKHNKEKEKSGGKNINVMTMNRDGSGKTNGYYNGYNVVNILSETLDTRIIDEIITPNLYRLVYGDGGADVYDDYYVPTFFDGATMNTEFMSMAGLYPISRTIWSNNMGDRYPKNIYNKYSLPAQLRAAGYDTYYFHNEIKINYERGDFIPNLGFKEAYFYDEMSGKQMLIEPGHKWPLDSEIARFIGEYAFTDERAAEYKNGKNFYMNVMTYSMHSGRKDIFADNIPAVRERYRDKKLPEIVVNYLAKAMEYDKLVGKVIDLLESRGLLKNTLINIYPDHYAYLIREVYTHLLEPRINSYKDFTVQKQKLIMLDGAKYGTGRGTMFGAAQNRGTDYTVSCTIDLPPTLLNMLLGTGAEYGRFFGNDMMDGSHVVFSDLSVFDGKGYLTIDGKALGNANVPKLRALQADAYERFIISQGIHIDNYFK